ncbi:hypothetical protein DdX_12214 [Ditylenchus destructor]|uniref:Uncharacterized protein n=1 Tax=Ditylenchus destructor TaxID=166010 RepID=A0AAD4R3S9_9BILA|nr:hypothetical protein DdX_12214 [Ditylenchus destructor]
MGMRIEVKLEVEDTRKQTPMFFQNSLTFQPSKNPLLALWLCSSSSLLQFFSLDYISISQLFRFWSSLNHEKKASARNKLGGRIMPSNETNLDYKIIYIAVPFCGCNKFVDDALWLRVVFRC